MRSLTHIQRYPIQPKSRRAERGGRYYDETIDSPPGAFGPAPSGSRPVTSASGPSPSRQGGAQRQSRDTAQRNTRAMVRPRARDSRPHQPPAPVRVGGRSRQSAGATQAPRLPPRFVVFVRTFAPDAPEMSFSCGVAGHFVVFLRSFPLREPSARETVRARDGPTPPWQAAQRSRGRGPPRLPGHTRTPKR